MEWISNSGICFQNVALKKIGGGVELHTYLTVPWNPVRLCFNYLNKLNKYSNIYNSFLVKEFNERKAITIPFCHFHGFLRSFLPQWNYRDHATVHQRGKGREEKTATV